MVVLAKSLVMCLTIALMVGFFTLLERKVLGYMQMRKGVNKVGVMGLPQPLTDAMKLFMKENPQINLSNKFIFMASPVCALVVMFSLWALYISSSNVTFMTLGVLFFLCVSSLNVYATLLSGWSSNSKYALLGAIRAVAQTISYEVSMALVMTMVVGLSLSFNLFIISKSQYPMMFSLMMFPIFILWLTTSMAETNRAPFDLAEGESELVSGFNVEYGGSEFAFLFIAEYGSIMLMSMLTEVLFLSGFMTKTSIMIPILVTMIAFTFLWVRASYPRMRYDMLMYLTWKTFLSLILGTLLMTGPFFMVYMN